MVEDESQTNETSQINVGITNSQRKKAPHRTSQRSVSLEVLKAERIFNQYCYPDTWFWKYPEWKQAALDIISSGIFEGDELKGHARSQNYPVVHGESVVLGDLIIHLVQKHFDYDVNLPSGRIFHRLEGSLQKEIVSEFDDHFLFVATIAQLCGIRKDRIQKVWDEWRKKVSVRAVKGEIPHHWRELIMDKMYPGRGYAPQTTPQQIARKFADIFLRYVPQAPAARIVKWVNVTLKSLGRPTVSESGLRTYISEEKQRRPQLQKQITE